MKTPHKFAVRLTALAAATLMLASFASCSVNDDSTSNTSDTTLSGKLTIACGAQEDWCQAMTAAFQAKTGVQTSYVRLSSGEAVARLEASKGQPEFDVWHGGPADGYGQAKNEDLLQAYVSPNAAGIEDKYKDKEGFWTGVYVGVLGFCSNTEVLNELGVAVPQTWDDLTNPKLASQVMMAHPATSGTAYTALWTQTVLRGGEEQGMDYMKKLNNSILQYPKTGSAPGEATSRGEVAAGIIFTHDCVKYKVQGADALEVTYPKDGTGYEIGGVAIIKDAQNLNAAKAYVDWALTGEAQDIGPTVNSFQVLTAPDATTDPRMAKLSEVNLINYDFVAAAAAKPALLTRFDNEVASEPTS